MCISVVLSAFSVSIVQPTSPRLHLPRPSLRAAHKPGPGKVKAPPVLRSQVCVYLWEPLPPWLAGAPPTARSPPRRPAVQTLPPHSARGAHPSPPMRGAPGVSGSPGGSEHECPRAGPANGSSGSYLGGWKKDGRAGTCMAGWLAGPSGGRTSLGWYEAGCRPLWGRASAGVWRGERQNPGAGKCSGKAGRSFRSLCRKCISLLPPGPDQMDFFLKENVQLLKNFIFLVEPVAVASTCNGRGTLVSGAAPAVGALQGDLEPAWAPGGGGFLVVGVMGGARSGVGGKGLEPRAPARSSAPSLRSSLTL